MKRNRAATEQRILEQAARWLTEQGLEAWGINAIAKVAGCDKVLIYRYFDGIEGLAERLMATATLFPEAIEGADWQTWAEALWSHWQHDAMAPGLLRAAVALPEARHPWAEGLRRQREAYTHLVAARLDHLAAVPLASLFVGAVLDTWLMRASESALRQRVRLFQGSGAILKPALDGEETAAAEEEEELPPEML